jgi:TonB family protein
MKILESSVEPWMLSYALNSLWQIPLVFAAAWCAARMLRRGGPAVEHRIWASALGLEALLPALSVAPLSRGPSHLLHALWVLLLHPDHAGGNAQIIVVPGAGYAHGTLGLPPYLLAGTAAVYTCSVAYFAGRLAIGLWKTHAVRRRAKVLALTGTAATLWSRSRHEFHVANPELLSSSEIGGPMTMGVRRQVLLLPTGFAANLREEDFAAALAHECAHMGRRDFARNLLYEVLSLPVAYHPLLRLTRARVAETREMVCDALAAEAVAGRERYTRSLLRLASLLVQSAPATNLHAIRIFDVNTFERRIMSLTENHVKLRGARRLALAALCVAIGIGTCASAMALRMDVSAPALQDKAQSTAPPRAAARVSGGVMAGNVLSKVRPIYPPDAKAAGIQGTVVLHAIIGKDGNVESLQVISGPKELAMSAWDAVKQWTYKPYLLNGNPTAVETTITVNYSLSR